MTIRLLRIIEKGSKVENENKGVQTKPRGAQYLYSSFTLAILSYLFLLPQLSLGQGVQTFTNNGTYTVPAGVNIVTVQCWGAGGKGGSRTSSGGGGGGGGGAFACSTFAVTPAATFPVAVGSGGNGAVLNGGLSSFGNPNIVRATGGVGVADNTIAGGAGGSAGTSLGFLLFNGGNGGTSTGNGAGGGGAAGLNGSGTNGGNASAGQSNGMNSGNGAAHRTGNSNGNNGFNYGGGGGGARRTNGTRNGGAGGNGLVTVSPTIWANPILGTNPSTSNPYTDGEVKSSNVIVSGIGYGAGLLNNNSNDRYNLRNFSTSNSINQSITDNKYIEFVITPQAGQVINFNSFMYTSQRSGTGPTEVRVRSSVDNFDSDIANPDITGGTVNLTSALFQSVRSAITFRIYAYGASNASGTFSIDNFFFLGTTAPTPYISSFAPSTACIGDVITIQGLNLNGASTVKFGGIDATFNVVNSTQITATVPVGATTGLIQILTPLGLAQSGPEAYVANMEGQGETQTGYAAATVNLSGINWNLDQALIGTSGSDFRNGSRSIRMRGYSSSVIEMTENRTNGLGAISFQYRRFSSDAQVQWKVEYSINNGISWVQAGVDFTPTANVQTFHASVNVAGNVRVRIIHSSGGNNSTDRRMNIDDITLTDNNEVANLVISSVPSIPGAFTSSAGTVCPGSTGVNYAVPFVDGVNYVWTYTGTGATINGSGNSVNIDFALNATAGTLRVVANTICGVSSPREIAIAVDAVVNPTITPTYCLPGGLVRLTASAGTAYLWSTGETTSMIEVDQAGNYTVQVTNAAGCVSEASFTVATELVTNGSFSDGNTGFTTTYTFVADAPGFTQELWPEGTYSIVANANFVHTFFHGKERNNGSGNIMVINGHPALGSAVWTQNNISVIPNTTYYFSAWAMSVVNGNNAILQFSINGNQVGTIANLPNGYTNTNGPYNWVRFYGTWNSGPSTTANLSIVNLNTVLGGNDFALDDVSFATLSPVALSLSPNVNGNAPVCVGSSIFLTSNAVGGASPFTYSWTGPSGFSSNLANPTLTNNATLAQSGTYQVTVTDAFGCTVTQSVSVTVNALPLDRPISVLSNTVCTGTGTSVVVANSEAGVLYQLRNVLTDEMVGNAINGNGASIEIPTGDLQVNTQFFVEARRAITGCVRQLTGTISISTLLTPVLNITNQAACSGTVNLTAPAVTAGSTGGGTLSYWNLNTNQTIYSEPFTGQNNKGAVGPGSNVDVTGVNWTVDVSGASLTANTDWFRVVSGQMEARDVDGPSYWISPIIDISTYMNVQFSLQASESGTLENDDVIFTEYSINGGVWQYASVNGLLIDDFTSAAVSQVGLSGNTLQIRVMMNCNADDELLRIDNVLVRGDEYVALATPTDVGSGTYFIQSNSSGCTDIKPVTVTVSSSPNASFNYVGSPFCNTASNPSAVITGSAGVFSSTSGLVFASTSTGEIDLLASAAGTYVVTNTISPSGVCSPVSFNRTITITPSPSASFEYGSNSLCQNVNAAPALPTYLNGGQAGTFTRSSNLLVLNSTTGAINIGASVPGNYAVINSLPATGGCAAVRDTAFITINPYTFDGAVSVSSSHDEICLGESVQLYSSTTPYLSVLLTENFNGSVNNWTSLSSSIGGTPANSVWTLRPSGYNSDNIFTTSDNSQFCVSHSWEQGTGTLVSSNILQSPMMSTVGYTSLQLDFSHYFRFNFTAGELARVQVSTDGGIWTTVATYTSTIGSPSSFQNATLNLSAFVGQPTFFVRFFHFSQGRSKYWAIDNVVVSGQSTNYNYAWNSDPAAFTSIAQNPILAPANSAFYILNTENTFGCSVTNSPIPISVKPVGQLTSTLTPGPICSGEEFSYTPTASLTGANILWTRPAVTGISNAAITTPQSVNPSEILINTSSVTRTVDYVYETTYDGCTRIEHVEVPVHPVPTVSVSGGATVCNGSGVQLTSSASGGFGTLTYNWSPATGLNDVSLPNPQANPDVATLDYVLTITDENGCSKESTPVTVSNAGFGGTPGLWIGAIDSDWNNCLNWSDGRVPTSTTNVILNNASQSSCELSGINTINSLTIESTDDDTIEFIVGGGSQLIVNGNIFINKISGDNQIALRLEGFGQITCNNLQVAGSAFGSRNAQFINYSSNSSCLINGDLIINSGGKLNLNDNIPMSSGASIRLKGNFIHNGDSADIDQGNSRFIFEGESNQFIQGIGSIFLEQLNLNLLNGSMLILENEIHLSKGLTLTNGKLDLNGNKLYLGSSVQAANVSGGSEQSYVIAWKGSDNGEVIHRVPSATRGYLFPVGDENHYTPFEVIMEQGTLNNAEISVKLAAQAHPNIVDASIYLKRHWEVIPQGIDNPLYSAIFGYNDIDAEGPASLMFPAKYNSGGWQSCMESGAEAIIGNGSVDTDEKRFTWNGITSFSIFTAIGNGTALPIELLQFTADQKENYVDLNWLTASEINNSHFIIERSRDTKEVEEIHRQNGAGNSSNTRAYSAKDMNPLNGVSYYRLRQFDFNGETTASEWIAVKYDTEQAVKINYVSADRRTGSIQVSCLNPASKDFSYSIFDTAGKILVEQSVQAVNENWQGRISAGDFSSGAYILRISINGKHLFEKFVY